ncbi:hypothetical protein EXN66_Car008440 [Channa argus]|uniref:Uncharacterized protein n=1 Tax=Channa argus TaxID=215402 RepID=A0A6G1PRK0_CHAAH|nr:hypothetical protein EXN66_Car008440 [Channa argus]
MQVSFKRSRWQKFVGNAPSTPKNAHRTKTQAGRKLSSLCSVVISSSFFVPSDCVNDWGNWCGSVKQCITLWERATSIAKAAGT